MVQIVSDLFAAGSDTVTNMIRWVVFLMIKYPDTMKKCQEEIDREVASDKLVSLIDRPKYAIIIINIRKKNQCKNLCSFLVINMFLLKILLTNLVNMKKRNYKFIKDSNKLFY